MNITIRDFSEELLAVVHFPEDPWQFMTVEEIQEELTHTVPHPTVARYAYLYGIEPDYDSFNWDDIRG